MANELTTLPSRSKEVMARRENLRALNEAMLESISIGMYPQLATFGTRFVIKKDGEIKEVDKIKIPVVLLNAKGPFEKKWWRGKFDPNKSEKKAPDCMSFDGVYPDSSVTDKQCENCATCEHNMFGSGTNAEGDPTKGKACQDRKLLVLHYGGAILGFSLPPGSIKAYREYITDLDQKGYAACEVATIIGFDSRFSYPVLTFTAHGPLSDEQMNKVEEIIYCDEVMEIINFGTKKQKTIAHTPVTSPPPIESKPVETVVEVTPEPETPPLPTDEEVDLGLGAESHDAAPPTAPKKETKRGAKTKENVIEPETTAAKIPSADEVDALLNL